MAIKEKIQHLIDLKTELAVLKSIESIPDDVKQRCIDYYSHEINKMLDDPYIYDKYYGLLQGGII